MSDETYFPRHSSAPTEALEVKPPETPPRFAPATWADFARSCWECGRERKSLHDGGNEWFCAHCREVYP